MTRVKRHERKTVVQKALSDRTTKKIKFFWVNAIKHNFFQVIVWHKINDRSNRLKVHQHRQKLNFIEKKIICDWIRRLCDQSYFFTYDIFKFMIFIVIESKFKSEFDSTNLKNNNNFKFYIGHNWSKFFLFKYSILQTIKIKIMNWVRQIDTTKIILKHWFKKFKKLMQKYNIKKINIWNMNEKEFVMKLTNNFNRKIISIINNKIVFVD